MLLKRAASVLYLLLFLPAGWLAVVVLAFSSDNASSLSLFNLATLLFGLPALLLLVGGAGGLTASFGERTARKELMLRIFLCLPIVSALLYGCFFFIA